MKHSILLRCCPRGARLNERPLRRRAARTCALSAARKSALRMKFCSVLVIARNTSIATARVLASSRSYKMLTSEDAPPFLCFCCFRAQKDEEVARLQSVVQLLKNEIDSLKMPQPNVHWPLLARSRLRRKAQSSPAIMVSKLLALYVLLLNQAIILYLLPPMIANLT